jgi:RNA polymerase sigma-70 factor (ECF subfamily)
MSEGKMQETEFEIIKKAQAGDKAAFDMIISAHSRHVTDLCRKYMRNSEEALDMAQDVFCAAYTSLDKFGFKSKLSTWLYRITVNLCINKLDMLKRRKYFDTDSIHGNDEDGIPEIQIRDTRMAADEELEAKETRRFIMSAMDDFDAQSRNVIILRDMQGLEYDEISEVMNIPLGSVKSKLNRAREKLKEKLIRKSGG